VTSFERNGSSGCMTGLNAKSAAGVSGCQTSGIHPARHVDDAEAEGRGGGRARLGRERRHHRVEERQGQGGADTLPRRNVRRDRCFFVMIMAVCGLSSTLRDRPRGGTCPQRRSGLPCPPLQARAHLERLLSTMPVMIDSIAYSLTRGAATIARTTVMSAGSRPRPSA
jgi:hypothetical protein